SMAAKAAPGARPLSSARSYAAINALSKLSIALEVLSFSKSSKRASLVNRWLFGNMLRFLAKLRQRLRYINSIKRYWAIRVDLNQCYSMGGTFPKYDRTTWIETW